MMLRVWLALLLGVFSTSLAAETGTLELATARGCFICHTVKTPEDVSAPLAPSYQEIAERYRGKAESQDYLVQRVLHGTAFAEQNWADEISMRFMPPNVNVTRLEAAEMTHWILGLPVDQAIQDRLARHENMLILSTTSGCMACHRMDPSPDNRLMPLAPSFKSIAERYAGDAEAHKKLVRSVLYGTRSASKIWPKVNMRFMPPSVALQKEAAADLVSWILELK